MWASFPCRSFIFEKKKYEKNTESYSFTIAIK